MGSRARSTIVEVAGADIDGCILAKTPVACKEVREGGVPFHVASRALRYGPCLLLCQLARPAPPGHECPGYASTEKPGEPGSWRSGSDFGAGFSRLFVSHVARAFMPGRGRRSQSGRFFPRHLPCLSPRHGNPRPAPAPPPARMAEPG